jgi:ABC-type uncharacterized transport system auxiliary subunit
MKKTCLLAVVILAGTGCFIAHAKRYFDLGVPVSGPAEPAFDRALLIDHPYVEGIYDDFRIVYRLSPTEVNYYAYNFWAERPTRLVRNMIWGRIVAQERFRRVDLEPGKEPAEWMLKIKVFRIEEEDRADRWFGRLAMAFEIVDIATGSVIATRAFDRIEPLEQKDPGLLAGVVSRILADEFDVFLRELAVKSK